jgi:hypothetical protein
VKAPAQSQFLSLAGTLEFVRDQRKAKLTYDAEVWRPVYRALLEGALSAIGDFEDRDGRVLDTGRDREVLTDDWRALRESDFHEACYRPRVLEIPNTEDVQGGPFFLTNERIETSQVRAWLGLDGAAENARQKKRPARSVLEKGVAGYIERSEADGRRPTQSGAENALRHMERGSVRQEFKRQAKIKGIGVHRGRPKKAPRENSRP